MGVAPDRTGVLGITSIFFVLPAGVLIGFAFALLLGGFLLLGRHPSSVIFVSLGTLTGSYAVDRLARGWYYLGGQNGIPSISSMTLGSYEFAEGPVFFTILRWRSHSGLSVVPFPDAPRNLVWRSPACGKMNNAFPSLATRFSTSRPLSFSLSGAIAGLGEACTPFMKASSGPTCSAL